MENNNQNMYGQQPNINQQAQKVDPMYGNNMQGTNMQGYGVNMAPKNPLFTKWLIISILQFLCCNNITGLISLILTIIADSDFKKGMMAEYESKMKGAKIATIIGLITGLLIYLFVIIYYIFIIGIFALSEF